jgi:hypothetical protein
MAAGVLALPAFLKAFWNCSIPFTGTALDVVVAMLYLYWPFMSFGFAALVAVIGAVEAKTFGRVVVPLLSALLCLGAAMHSWSPQFHSGDRGIFSSCP